MTAAETASGTGTLQRCSVVKQCILAQSFTTTSLLGDSKLLNLADPEASLHLCTTYSMKRSMTPDNLHLTAFTLLDSATPQLNTDWQEPQGPRLKPTNPTYALDFTIRGCDYKDNLISLHLSVDSRRLNIVTTQRCEPSV